jgi:SH3-like domain-containing protein
MKYKISAMFILVCCATAFPVLASEIGRETGLPIPRFVSLKSSEINMRKGPGTRYPIEWVYRRDRLPVEVIEEFDHWRQIRDADGSKGWLHKNMLSGVRTVFIKGKVAVELREDPENNASVVAKLEPGVIANLLECEKDWCKIEARKHEGWLQKKLFYGAYDKELYNP